MVGPGVVATSGDSAYKALNNNTNSTWWKDAGLRRLNLGILFMFGSAAANGFDGSLMNGLLAIPACKFEIIKLIFCQHEQKDNV